MRIIDTDEKFSYVIADAHCVVEYNNFWGIGVLVKKQDVSKVVEKSELDILNFLKVQDNILGYNL